MKIIMISDLHISNEQHSENSAFKIGEAYKKLVAMKDYLSKILVPGERIVIFICGDIIDKGDEQNFIVAEQVFDYLVELLEEWSTEFIFIPGNHDMCKSSFKFFDQFINRYQAQKHNFSEVDTYARVYENINFIFASSMIHKDYGYGKVNFEGIKNNAVKEKVNVLVMHHSIVSEDDTDKAAVRNYPQLLQIMHTSNINYILHGHTHTGKEIMELDSCQLIEVGSLFMNIDNINNQFNVIDIDYGDIRQVINVRYFADRSMFVGNKIYPRSNEVLHNIKKLHYKCPLNYIPRKIVAYDTVTDDMSFLLYGQEKASNLYDVCMEEKRIVILGEAGCGKTTELDNLLFQLSNNTSSFLPIRIRLNTYTNRKIEELIPYEVNTYIEEHIVVVFDGFDEIEPQYINLFVRELNQYVEKHKNMHIVVSSRSNFYSNSTPDKKILGTFQEFREYKILPLSLQDIKSYSEKKNIDYVSFYKQAREKELSDLISIPFYVVKLLEIYREDNNLPNKSEVMEILIRTRFLIDSNKYTTTKQLMDYEYEITLNLQRVAFALQCLQKNYLTNIEYNQLLDFESRKVLEYSGIWARTKEGNWQFEHNNFREYLAAKFLMDKSVDYIIKIITFKVDDTHIKSNWINTLSYLMTLYKDDKLLDWLIQNNSLLLPRFEISRLPEALRTKIFINVLNLYKQKNSWLSRSGQDEIRLVNFGQSLESLQFLLEEIKSPIHFRALSNALVLLRKFKSLYGKREEIKDSLLNCCKNPQTRVYECEKAIIALAELKINDSNVTNELMKVFGASKESEIRYGMYTYLLLSNQQDEYIDYFFEGIDCYYGKKCKNIGEMLKLVEGLKSIETEMAVRKTLQRFSDKRVVSSFTKDVEVIEHSCKVAVKLYQQGRKEIFEEIYRAYIANLKQHQRKYVDVLYSFFKETNTMEMVYNRMIDSDNYKFLIWEEDVVNECMGDFTQRYLENRLPDNQSFINYVARMNSSTAKFEQLSAIIKEKDGVTIQERQIVDYKKLEMEGIQRYFNTLFDKKAFGELVDELIKLIGIPNITYEELRKVTYEYTQMRKDLENVKWAICSNNFNSRIAKDFMREIDWEMFSIHTICCLLKDNFKDLKISRAQKDYLQNYFNCKVENIDFNNAITYTGHNTYEWSYEVEYLIDLCWYLELECKENIILDMLMIPASVFPHGKNNEVHRKYLESMASRESFRERIGYNIANNTLHNQVLELHIEYCMEYGLEIAIPLALEVCRSEEESEGTKRVALKYLMKQEGPEYIYKEIVPFASDELMREIANELDKTRNPELEKELIKRFEKDKEQICYLSNLIIMNSAYGLKVYLEMTKEKKGIPDYIGKDDDAHFLTESIASIDDIKMLPIILELIVEKFSDGFKDANFDGLYSSLYKALKAMGVGENYTIICDEIINLININPNNMEMKGFCYRVIDEIKEQYCQDNEEVYTISQVKKMIE